MNDPEIGYPARSLRASKFIRDYIVVHGYGPTMREIAEGVGYASLGATHRLIERMDEDGLLDRGPARSQRTIRISGPMITPEGGRRREREM